MYLNIITLKSGRILGVQTEIPISIDKLSDTLWLIINDENDGQIVNILTSEIAAITSQDADKVKSKGISDRNNKAANSGAKARKKGIKIE